MTKNEIIGEIEKLYNQCDQDAKKDFYKTPDKPLNIVFDAGLAAPFDGDTPLNKPLAGQESSIIYISKELVKAGHKVTVFTENAANKYYDGVLYDHPENLLNYCNSNQVDVLIFIKAQPLLKNLKVKLAVFWAKGDTDQAATIEFLENSFNGNIVDRIFTISNYQKAKLREFANIPEKKFYRTRNGINPQYFSEIKERKKYKMMYISVPDRGLVLLADIFPKIREKVPQAYLEYYSALKHYGLSDAVENYYYGHIHDKLSGIEGIIRKDLISHPEMAKQLAEAYLLIYPNIVNESFCISVLESQAAGTPVVTSARGALPEVLEDGKTGICISGDPLSPEYQEQFAETVVSLLNAPQKWQEFSNNGRQRALENYPWEMVAGEWIEEFNKMLYQYDILKSFFELIPVAGSELSLTYEEKEHIYKYYILMTEKLEFTKLKILQKDVINYFLNQSDFPKKEKLKLMLELRTLSKTYL